MKCEEAPALGWCWGDFSLHTSNLLLQFDYNPSAHLSG